MAKRRFQLSKDADRQLREREQQAKGVAERKRLQAVRLYGSGMAIARIMDICLCAESSIREWVREYQRKGLAGLARHYQVSAQNASKLSAAQREELRERLQRYGPQQVLAPQRRRSQAQFWTVDDVRLAVADWYGVVYKDVSSYRHLLHASGLSYQRAEGVYASRPSQAALADFEAELEKK
jgi:transposase